MNKELVQEKDMDTTELEEVIPFDDAELDNDIRDWLQIPPVKLQDYGFEAEREEEYFAILNEYQNI